MIEKPLEIQPFIPIYQNDTDLDKPIEIEKEAIQQQIQAPQSSQREEVAIMQALVAQLTRKQLYDEIWDISASGVAKKYDIPIRSY